MPIALFGQPRKDIQPIFVGVASTLAELSFRSSHLKIFSMKNVWTFALLIFSLSATSQNVGHFSLNEIIPCPFDPSKTIKAYQDWTIYQTLDGTWSGIIDSTRCISLANTPSEGILLQDADLTRPVFLRSKKTASNNILLYTNQTYSAFARIHHLSSNYELVTGINCPENLCSGIIIGIEIPDSTGNGTAMRWYADVPDNGTTSGSFETCIPTEYFDENYLKEFIIKLTFAPSTLPSAKIRMAVAGMDYWTLNGYVYDIIAPEWTFEDSSYDVHVQYVATDVNGWNFNYLLMYNDVGNWPSSVHPSYVEGRPQINTPDPKTINLIVEEYENLIPQPFAFIRGALVEGSDSIRHTVNLVNEGGDICMGGAIDFVVGPNTKYVHKGGHVNFEGVSACMMFRDGGALEVADNTFFQYGQGGKGILALRPGSTILLGEGSTLLFDNLLWLQGIPTAQFPDHQLYMELNPGSTLSFTENASIFNGLSINSDTKLNIYMNGGLLDDSKLKPGVRALINRIYPKPNTRFSDNVKLLQNPVSGSFQIVYLSGGNEKVDVEFYDLNGRYFGKRSFQATVGYNYFQVELEDVAPGIYMADVRSSVNHVVLKFAKH